MDIQKILDDHKLWLAGKGGKRADLRGVDLQRADLQGADLRGAKLQGANLQQADLRWANLRQVDLQQADLRGADLQRANLDCSCWPLRGGSIGVKLDDQQRAQLLYHALCNMDASKHKMLFRYARSFVNKNFKRVISNEEKPL